MSVLSSTPTWTWPADVLAFAAEQRVDSYLEPLREATVRLFPMAKKIAVSLELDPEIRDLRWIVFEVGARDADIPDYVAAMRAWHDELFRICPARLTHNFCQNLVVE